MNLTSTMPDLSNPFPGLRCFLSEEDYLFFGRHEQIEDLLRRLRTNRLVAVVGTSGSGKSSLVRAGLLPAVLGGGMAQAGSAWEIAVMRPGGSPMAHLARALCEAGLDDADAEDALSHLHATLSRSRNGLIEAVRQSRAAAGSKLLLVVDQFEELFRFNRASAMSQEEAIAFVNLLLYATQQADQNVYVVLTMRSDFLGECSQFLGLAEAVNDGEFLIPRMTRDQIQEAIEGPIRVRGAAIAPRLLFRLLNDVEDNQDQLPVLQHALMRTWDLWQRSPQSGVAALDLEHYDATGGMHEALSRHADEIFDALPSGPHRTAAVRIFKALTERGPDGRGIRRPTRLGQLVAIAAVEEPIVHGVIEAYRAPGVTFLMPPVSSILDDDAVIDISHESLMRVWRRLRGWVEDEAQSARIYHRLRETAALHGEKRAGLYHDPDLQIALSWREAIEPNSAWAGQVGGRFDEAMAFLDTSREAAEREENQREAARQRELERARQLAETQVRVARLFKRFAGGLAVALCLAVALAIWALTLRQEAKRQEAAANHYAVEANTQAKVASDNAKKAETEARAARKAEQEATVRATAEAAAKQDARAAEEAGRKLLYTTDMRLAPFVWRDDRTTAQKLRILLAKHIPDSQVKGNNHALPTNQKPDLRGFEWYYYQHLLESSAAVFSGHAVSIADGAFTSNGQLVTLDQNGQVRRWDLDSQDEDQARRRELPGGPGAQVRALSPDGRLAALAEGNKVHVFDTSTSKEQFQVDSANAPARRLIFTPDSGRLVIVDDKIRWCAAASGQVIASVDQNFNRGSSLALSTDGLTLAVVGHGFGGHQFSIFRLDATTKTVTPQAKFGDAGIGPVLSAAALSRDGRLIAVGSKLFPSVSLYDAGTGRGVAHDPSAHASPISAMTFSGDGFKLVTADVEGTIKIWEDARKLTSKSAASMTLKGHEAAITHVGFSSAGKQLVSTSADKTARVWDMDHTGAAIRVLERHGNPCFVARFSPDGQLIAAAGGGSVRLWDAATGKLVRKLSAGDKGRISSVAFSPTDNRLLAVGYGEQADVSHVVLWDIDASTELARLPGATDRPDFHLDERIGVIGALAFSPDGKYLVAGFGSLGWFGTPSSPNPLKVWEVATRRLIRRLSGHTGYCVSLDFSQDGARLASGSRDGTAIIWSTETWKATQTLRNPDPGSIYSQAGVGVVDDVAFSPDGKTLAMASREGSVLLWDVATGKLLDTLKGHSSAVSAVVFSPDGRTLATGGSDQTVRLWNVETRRELMQLDSGSVELGEVHTVSFSPDGQELLAGGYGSTAFWSTALVVWNDPDRAAEKLRHLLQSNADFQTRIRMLSENFRLHAALAKLDAKDVRVSAALAAAQANWHASRQAWPEAALAFDRLTAAAPIAPETWLRTPGLLRLATALLHQNRPRDAAALLTGGAKRRTQDGVPAAVDQVGVGFAYSDDDGKVQVTELLPGFSRLRAGLLPGDVIVKVNDTELTRESLDKLAQLLAGEAGTKVRLTVRHSGSEQPQAIELTRERFVHDAATGELLRPLRAAINERLAREPRNPGLLELRAALSGQWSGFEEQATSYTAAIDVLKQQDLGPVADLQRLYRRRGNAYLGLKQWQQALDDYARIITGETTDEDLLANQALALAGSLLGVGTLVPTSEQEGAKWSFTTTKPADLWTRPDFNDSSWQVGVGAFGAVDFGLARTAWTTPDIWLRRRFEFEQAKNVESRYLLRVNCDDNAEVFLNGKPLARKEGYTELKYVILELEPHVRDQFVQGTNTLAVHCLNTIGTGYIDVGLYRVPAGSLALTKRRFAALENTDAWAKLAAAYQLRGDQQAIDQLVARRPKLAGRIGDLFIQDQDKDWSRAVEIYSRGITAETTEVELLSKRAHAYEALKNWDAATADWSRAATGNPEGAKLLAEFAQRLATGGQGRLANGPFEKAQALYERSLEADAENDLVATDLAQLLSDQHENGNSTRWTVLKPTEMKSEGGATLTLQPDGSVLASGTNPDRDVYTLSAKTELNHITAVRLEALPDPSLPNNGPGRDQSGNFHLNELRVFSGGRPCPLTNIIVVNDETGQFRNVIDGKLDDTQGWGNYGWPGKTNTAVIATRLDRAPGDDLKIELYFSRSQYTQHNLGRFRLSVSGAPAAFEREQKRVADLKVRDPWAKLVALYHVKGDQPAIDSLLKAHPTAVAGIGDRYAADKNWNRAVAEYTKAITAETKDANLLAKRAEAYDKLKQWDLAVADWTRASLHQPDVAFERLKSAGAGPLRLETSNGGAGSMEVVDGTLVFTTTVVTGTGWHVQAIQGQLQLENGAEYVIRFKMKSPDSCAVTLVGAINQEDWHLIGLNETFVPPTEFRDYEFTFVPHDVVPGNNRILFELGTNPGKVMVKEIVILKKFEGNESILGPGVGAPRKLAIQGQTAQAAQAYAKALAEAPDQNSRTRILDELPQFHGVLTVLHRLLPNDKQIEEAYRRMVEKTTAEFSRKLDALTRVIQNQPDRAAGYLARGDWYGGRGLWRKAADDFHAAYRLQPDAQETMTGMQLGFLLAHLGEAGRYRDHCKDLLERSDKTSKNEVAEWTLKTRSLLGPDPVGDPDRLARLAEVAVSGDPTDRWYGWKLFSKGLYEYRAGRIADAVTTCRKAPNKAKNGEGEASISAAAFAVLAMALHRSGDAWGARRSLAEGKKLTDGKVLVFHGSVGDEWHDWLAAQFLYREAEGLIAGKKSEQPK
jgi:WD40 repeat protein/tetratricopeptide (TPR) repeat protein/energy-coupling factor transporter ATP-binding protein EcfA2